MPEEQYIKESDGKSYLLLPKERETFEEQMIRSAMLRGTLPMVKSERDDTYKYEITGRKTLAMTFERVPMNAEQVEQILKGILDVLEQGREYLLLEENYVLLPEYIYLRIPTYEVTLCYYPDYGIPFAEQMGKLFEMFLNRVDYREEKAIAMVYALYMQLQEPDMTLERMREKLQEQTKTYEERTESYPRDREREEKESEHLTIKFEKASQEKDNVVSKPEKKREGVWERLRKEVGMKLLHGAEKTVVIPEVMSPVASVPYVMEAVPEWGAQYTRVLSVKPEMRQPALVSEKTGETVFLTKFPFYVGSLPGYMDYVIKEDTVSRFHAKFIKQGEEIYLVDLNSTNGTRVNGRSLNVQEQARVKSEDRVCFADKEYVFKEKE